MRHSTFTVFDEFIPKGTVTGAPVFTGAQFNAHLGRSNQLGIHIVADNLTVDTATKSIYCFVEHSADGRLWMQRSNQANSFAAGDADLTLAVTTTTTLVQAMWSDCAQGKSAGTGTTDTSGPLLGFVRLRLFFENNVIAGHVKINVTQRDH